VSASGQEKALEQDVGGGVTVRAIVDGKVVRLKLSPGVAQAWRQNRGKTMIEKRVSKWSVDRKTGDRRTPA
jgi:hypothetical protein